MKKTVFCIVIFVLLFSLVFAQAPQTVSATGISEGSWILPGASANTTYTTVNIEKEAETAVSWVRLFSDGIKISSPTKICYSFHRGAFHWVPKFMQLKKGNWTSISSTIEYIHGVEGGAYACAEPSEAGTFALFAYYNGPNENIASQPQLPLCTDVTFTRKTYGNSGDGTTITQPFYIVATTVFTKLEILSYTPTTYVFKDNIRTADIAFNSSRGAYVGTIYGLYEDDYNPLEEEGLIVRLSNDSCYIDVSDFTYDS